MQRAAASESISNPHSRPELDAKQPYTENPQTKRRKLEVQEYGPVRSLEECQNVTGLDGEETKTPRTINSIPEIARESKWVLDAPNDGSSAVGNSLRAKIHIMNTGYSDIDSGTLYLPSEGRKSFGNFNRQIEVSHKSRAILPGRIRP